MKVFIKAFLLSILFIIAASLVVHGQNWKTVKEWKGTGDMQTDTFRPSSDTWRIVWESEIRNKNRHYGQSNFTSFSIYLKNGKRYPARKVANATNYTSNDTIYFYESKKCKLQIKAKNRSYRVLVQVKGD